MKIFKTKKSDPILDDYNKRINFIANNYIATPSDGIINIGLFGMAIPSTPNTEKKK